jgi:nicotinate-nucleotide pyrophosphorylase (carboxylating)
LTPQEIRSAVRTSLAEDLGPGDATTLACIPLESRSLARMMAREDLTVAGLQFAEIAFRELDPNAVVTRVTMDGHRAPKGTCLLSVEGSTRAVLSAERVALNYVQRLSGVASITHRFMSRIEGTGVRLLDTRKTTPGWRRFEKYAVTCGGGTNHRVGLHDLILIKDNHLAALADAKPNAIAAAVARARAAFPKLRVEVEADTLEQAAQAADAGADIILLDNMSPAQLREAVTKIGGRSKTEASGGVRLDTIRAIAESGVDFISVGALTHSAPAVDIGLDFE